MLDGLGLDRFVTIGWSGGGPRALACAALLHGPLQGGREPRRRGAVDAEGLRFLAGMGPENVGVSLFSPSCSTPTRCRSSP